MTTVFRLALDARKVLCPGSHAGGWLCRYYVATLEGLENSWLTYIGNRAHLLLLHAFTESHAPAIAPRHHAASVRTRMAQPAQLPHLSCDCRWRGHLRSERASPVGRGHLLRHHHHHHRVHPGLQSRAAYFEHHASGRLHHNEVAPARRSATGM